MILMVNMLTGVATALTIDEYIALSTDEKIKVFQGKPDLVLDDLSKLLQLYTIGLRDESPKVQRSAGSSSFALVKGLQHYKTRSIPLLGKFSHEDSAAFQEALVAMLEHDDLQFRYNAATSLVYSAPPNPQIEAILLEHLETEDYSNRRNILIEMAKAGYSSERFVAFTIELMRSEDRFTYPYAAKVLALLTPDAAVDTLIEIAAAKETKREMSRFSALQALAAYGRRAMRAKPVLERLIEDRTILVGMREDFYKRVASTLEAITLDKPQPSNLRVVKLAPLWPLALPGAETSEAQELETSAGDSADPLGKPRDHRWIWLGALVLVIIAVWIVLNRFKGEM